MATLDELARTLGGVVQRTDTHDWLDTTIGELRAVVSLRHDELTTSYDLAVFMPESRELDPFQPPVQHWRLDGPHNVVPRLRHGYVFVGCCSGVLHAKSLSPPSLEQVVGALWELTYWARKPWRPLTEAELNGPTRKRRRRRQRQQRMLIRLGFVVIVVVLAALFRRR